MKVSNISNRRVLVGMCVVMVWALAWSPGAVAGHQATPTAEGGSWVTAVGSEVTWATPWVFNEERSVTDSDVVGMLVFELEESFTIVVQGEMPNIENALGLTQGYVGGETEQRVTLDGGLGDPVSYWLDAIPVNGEPYGSFALARGVDGIVTLTVYLAPVASFAEEFASAQEGIAIDGAAVFDGVGGDGLQDLLDQAAPAEESVAEESTGDNESSSKLGGEEDQPDTGSWTDPTYGVEVTWIGDWDAGDRGEETLVLLSADGSVFLNLSAMSSRGASTSDFAEMMSGVMDDLGVEVGPSAIYVDDDNVVLVGILEGTTFVQEVILVEGGDLAIVVTVMVAPGSDLDDTIAMYRDSVLIAGIEPLDGWESISI